MSPSYFCPIILLNPVFLSNRLLFCGSCKQDWYLRVDFVILHTVLHTMSGVTNLPKRSNTFFRYIPHCFAILLLSTCHDHHSITSHRQCNNVLLVPALWSIKSLVAHLHLTLLLQNILNTLTIKDIHVFLQINLLSPSKTSHQRMGSFASSLNRLHTQAAWHRSCSSR